MHYSQSHLDDVARAMELRMFRHPVRDLECEAPFLPDETYAMLANDWGGLRAVHRATKTLDRD